MLGISYSAVASRTKRYFGTDGQRIARTAEPEPQEWIPIIERVDRVRSHAARHDTNSRFRRRIKAMLAHVRGEAVDPSTARKAMDERLAEPEIAEVYNKRGTSIEPVFGNIKGNLGYRRFARRSLPAVQSEWRLMCTVHNLLKLRQELPPDRVGSSHSEPSDRPVSKDRRTIRATASAG